MIGSFCRGGTWGDFTQAGLVAIVVRRTKQIEHAQNASQMTKQ